MQNNLYLLNINKKKIADSLSKALMLVNYKFFLKKIGLKDQIKYLAFIKLEKNQ